MIEGGRKKRPHGAFDSVIQPDYQHQTASVLISLIKTDLIKQENGLFRLDSQGRRHSTSGIQGQPETVVVRAVRRGIRVAIRRPAIRGIVVPAAAAVHPVRASMDHPPFDFLTHDDENANSAHPQLEQTR